MPLSRHKIVNEYGLGGRELYRTADRNDPEAVLEGVAMAGLVGVLRQLGDLAEFAAEVFHGLHDEVMSAAARGYGLMLRVQQLEAKLPAIEKDSYQREYLNVASNRGAEWHANVKVEHGLVTKGDMPRFIMESIKQCHGPPKLFTLDKYDIDGEGACLRRYTNPSFFKTDSACSSMLQEDIRRERRPLKAMEIRPNLHNSEIFKPPNAGNTNPKLETDVSGQAADEVPQRRRQLKYRQLNGSVFRSLRPQMQNLYGEDSSGQKAHSVDYSDVKFAFTDSPDSITEVRDIAVDASADMEKQPSSSSSTKQEIKTCIMSKEDELVSDEASSRSSDTPKYQTGILPDVGSEGTVSSNGYRSEVDIYVDALATMESEVETDSENKERWCRRAFVRMESSKTCSDTCDKEISIHNAASRSSSFWKKDLLTPYYSDVASVTGEETEHHQEDVAISSLPAKPVVCKHERTRSLEELLARDANTSESDMREPAATDSCPTESTPNGTVSTVASNQTLDRTKKTKETSKILSIPFKKTVGKKSRHPGSGERIASREKAGILPRKLSKKHDPFSRSLRNMAKQLLELKYESTQDNDPHELEQSSEECDVKCLKMARRIDEMEEEGAIHKVPSDSAEQDEPKEAKKESEHVVAPTDSLEDDRTARIEGNLDLQQIEEDPLLDENNFQGPDVLCSIDLASPGSREEVCTSDMQLTSAHKDQIEAPSDGEAPEEAADTEPSVQDASDLETEPSPQGASDLEGELEERILSDEEVSSENADESHESDAYPLDDESTEYVEEQVVSDGIISSPGSLKLSDHACQITPLVLPGTDACNRIDQKIPETDGTLQAKTIGETDLPTCAPESVLCSDVAVPDNEQYSSHHDTTVLQSRKTPSHGEVAISNYASDGPHEQPLPLEPVPILAAPELIVSTEELREVHRPIGHEPYIYSVLYLYDSSSPETSGDTLAPDSTDLPLPNPSSFAWMLNGATQQRLETPSSEPAHETPQDTEDAPPLPPLPPMQWRATKLQIGSEAAFSNLGGPPRPKPLVKQHVSESNSSPCVRTQEAEVVLARSPYDTSTSQKEMPHASFSNLDHTVHKNEISTNPLLEPSVEDTKENDGHETEGDKLKTSELLEHRLDSEDSMSKPRLEEQLSPSVHELSNGVSGHDDVQLANLSTREEDEECESSDHREKEFYAVMEEELAQIPPAPKPPRYPLFEVTSHDRSMLRKAPTLIQPSPKLSDERNTVLEQIKNKSFNLKPVLARRPNVMGGPRTNLKVVAILERANAIRQVMADDDDGDSWSE